MSAVTLVEVGPRDGFQSIGPVIPTASKIDMIQRLYSAGVRRMEAAAFVSQSAVPQLADAADIVAMTNELPGFEAQVLVPNLRHAERALEAGATNLAFVLSVSEKHNQSNVRRTPTESVEQYRQLIESAPGIQFRVNVATAFDCPFDGPVPAKQTLELLEPLIDAAPHAEICLCDTTGRVTPDRVGSLFTQARSKFVQLPKWAFHGHDTYGMGLANVMAAWQSGVDIIDASVAGLGGCPFAPGATGNVATEDVVWMFERMGVATGLDVNSVIDIAQDACKLPGSKFGGRVREAVTASQCRKA